MQAIPQNIVIMLIIILVPIIPAYLLFKLLPATTVVKGPFKGLKIDLSGAFAGYFLIFLVLVGIRTSFQSTNYQEWTAIGRIVPPDAGAVIYYVDPRYVTFSTPAVKSDSNGNFSLTFLVTSDGRYDFPYMYINYPDYAPLSFFLGPKEKNVQNGTPPIKIDMEKKVVYLGEVHLVKGAPAIAAKNAGAANLNANPYLANSSQ